METLRLRVLQDPDEVQRLLQLCIASAGLLPQDARPIRDAQSVPEQLRRVLTQATDRGRVWCCFAKGARAWLFTAEMCLALARERGTPVLQVTCYSDDLLESSATWTTDPRGAWHRLSY